MLEAILFILIGLKLEMPTYYFVLVVCWLALSIAIKAMSKK